MKKKTEKISNERIFKKVKSLEIAKVKLEKEITTIRQVVKKSKAEMNETIKELNVHIGEPMASIKIKGRDGDWEEWTGMFSLSPKEKKEIILAKVEEHFDRYFRDNNLDKEFAIFITIAGIRTLYKIIKT